MFQVLANQFEMGTWVNIITREKMLRGWCRNRRPSLVMMALDQTCWEENGMGYQKDVPTYYCVAIAIGGVAGPG